MLTGECCWDLDLSQGGWQGPHGGAGRQTCPRTDADGGRSPPLLPKAHAHLVKGVQIMFRKSLFLIGAVSFISLTGLAAVNEDESTWDSLRGGAGVGNAGFRSGFAAGRSGFTPGFRPGVGPGFRPGVGPGFRPGVGPGFRPGFTPGFRPGVGPGFRPGFTPGFRPGVGPGFRPGYVYPGYRPYYPGYYPNYNPYPSVVVPAPAYGMCTAIDASGRQFVGYGFNGALGACMSATFSPGSCQVSCP